MGRKKGEKEGRRKSGKGKKEKGQQGKEKEEIELSHALVVR